MSMYRYAAACAAAICLSVSSFAGAAENPASLPGGTIVTAAQAKDLIAKGAKVVDVRSGNEFAEARIKGAVLVAYKEKSAKVADFDMSADTFNLDKLPGGKGDAMIFYCNGLDCWKSYKASVTAIKAGYTQINWLRGGMPEWKAAGGAIE